MTDNQRDRLTNVLTYLFLKSLKLFLSTQVSHDNVIDDTYSSNIMLGSRLISGRGLSYLYGPELKSAVDGMAGEIKSNKS